MGNIIIVNRIMFRNTIGMSLAVMALLGEVDAT